MLQVISNPTDQVSHSVDAVPEWMWPGDKAWDAAKSNADTEKLGEKNAAAHPVNVYMSGRTRYDLSAKITLPDALRVDGGPETVTVAHYLLPGATPTRFVLRSLGAFDWAAADHKVGQVGWLEFARRGLSHILDAAGADGKPTRIDPPRDGSGHVSEAWLDQVSKTNRDLLDALGYAVWKLSQNEVSRAEGKP